ncbi:hypothetical protein ACFVV7_26840 [Streptomyces globisporus]|uniref:hypothetical protein n=1 Tax=Streptomyces globisporus TaxID=1908 RepID=UPI0036DD7287
MTQVLVSALNLAVGLVGKRGRLPDRPSPLVPPSLEVQAYERRLNDGHGPA